MKRRLPSRMIGLAVLGMMCCATFGACSAAGRYRVLTFFFDGVPLPEGVEPSAETSSPANERTEIVSTGVRARRLVAEPRQPPPQPRMTSVHQPYAEGRCNECHDMSSGGLNDIAKDPSLCDKCHLEERQRDGWDHGPLNLGTCIPCHVAHQSEHPRLLTVEMTELCLGCHVEIDLESTDHAEYHEVPNLPDCVACHDPHRMY